VSFLERVAQAIRQRVFRWLGIDPAVSAYIGQLKLEHRALEETVRSMAETNRGLAQALQAAVGQLNRNTVMMQRWATESATLSEIERRHARKESRIIGANGHIGEPLIFPKAGA